MNGICEHCKETFFKERTRTKFCCRHCYLKATAKSPEHRTWIGMKARCLNKNATGYSHYGGRGIKICKRWLGSLENFIEDMGPRPSPDHSIDRINNNKGYSPSNCKWSNGHEQSINKSNNVMLRFRGETLCVADWARRVGLGSKLISSRLRIGWSAEKALTTKKRW